MQKTTMPYEENQAPGDEGWRISQAVDPCLDTIYPGYWSEVFGRFEGQHSVMENPSCSEYNWPSQEYWKKRSDAMGRGYPARNGWGCTNYSGSNKKPQNLNAAAGEGMGKYMSVDYDWVEAWSVSHWKKSLMREGLGHGALHSTDHAMGERVENIVASIWKKVEHEMDVEETQTASRQDYETTQRSSSIEEQSVRMVGLSMREGSMLKMKSDAITATTLPDRTGEAPSIPRCIEPCKVQSVYGSGNEIQHVQLKASMVDLVNENHVLVQPRSAFVNQKKEWQGLSFADRGLVRAKFGRWEAHAQKARLMWEAASVYSRQHRQVPK